MKHCVIEDSSFIVAAMDQNDKFHSDAIFIFKKLLENKEKIKIILPPIALYEIIVTLHRKGIDHKIIEKKIMNLLHIKEIIITSITEASAFKHCKSFLGNKSQEEALRTIDFLIVSLAQDYEAQIITFDKKMWEKVKPCNEQIYFCSRLDRMKDESAEFLEDLQTIINPVNNARAAIKDVPF
jgi:predicted nucleic acid-binding protein